MAYASNVFSLVVVSARAGAGLSLSLTWPTVSPLNCSGLTDL